MNFSEKIHKNKNIFYLIFFIFLYLTIEANIVCFIINDWNEIDFITFFEVNLFTFFMISFLFFVYLSLINKHKNSNKILAIYGSGGLGQEIYQIAVRENKNSLIWSDIVFIDDIRGDDNFYGTKTYSFETALLNKNKFEFIIAVGEVSLRKKLYQKLENNSMHVATLIDSTALISPFAKIGKGSIIREFSIISTNAVIGENCLIQPYACIGHDTVIGKNSVSSSFFAPGGGTHIGEDVYMGMASSIKEGLVIGDRARISMGSSVFRDVASGETVIGNPARITLGDAAGTVFKKNKE